MDDYDYSIGEALSWLYQSYRERYNKMEIVEVKSLFNKKFEGLEETEVFLSECIKRFLFGGDLGEDFFPFLKEHASKSDLKRWRSLATQVIEEVDGQLRNTPESALRKENAQALQTECELILMEKFQKKYYFAGLQRVVAELTSKCFGVLPK